MTKIFILILFLFSFKSKACQYSLKFKNHSDILSNIQVQVKNLLAPKKYLPSDTPTYNITLNSSKRLDPHSGYHFVASSLSVRDIASGQMLYYVHGQGKHFESEFEAHSLENFLLSIEKAIGHLPTCN